MTAIDFGRDRPRQLRHFLFKQQKSSRNYDFARPTDRPGSLIGMSVGYFHGERKRQYEKRDISCLLFDTKRLEWMLLLWLLMFQQQLLLSLWRTSKGRCFDLAQWFTLDCILIPGSRYLRSSQAGLSFHCNSGRRRRAALIPGLFFPLSPSAKQALRSQTFLD